MGANLRVREAKISFRRKQKHGLSKLLKSVTDASDDALEVIVKLMKSDDERVAKSAADKILDLRKELEVIINTDEIQRMMLESKNPDRKGALEDDDDDTPEVDFTEVQQIN